MKCAQTTDSSFAYEDLSDSGLTLNYMVIRVNLLLIYIYTNNPPEGQQSTEPRETGKANYLENTKSKLWEQFIFCILFVLLFKDPSIIIKYEGKDIVIIFSSYKVNVLT